MPTVRASGWREYHATSSPVRQATATRGRLNENKPAQPAWPRASAPSQPNQASTATAMTSPKTRAASARPLISIPPRPASLPGSVRRSTAPTLSRGGPRLHPSRQPAYAGKRGHERPEQPKVDLGDDQER